jgi:hypothetical protein
VNTEDKLAWCEKGADAEALFTVGRLFDLGLVGHINLEKASNKFTHDLFVQFKADLKTIRTPLFKAQEMYGIDPQYAITFNLKDGERYAKLYPNIVVVFDVKWEQTTMNIGGFIYEVKPMHETYAGFLNDIRKAIMKSGGKKIEYSKRVDDNSGNAKASWVFDVRELQRL